MLTGGGVLEVSSGTIALGRRGLGREDEKISSPAVPLVAVSAITVSMSLFTPVVKLMVRVDDQNIDSSTVAENAAS